MHIDYVLDPRTLKDRSAENTTKCIAKIYKALSREFSCSIAAYKTNKSYDDGEVLVFNDGGDQTEIRIDVHRVANEAIWNDLA